MLRSGGEWFIEAIRWDQTPIRTAARQTGFSDSTFRRASLAERTVRQVYQNVNEEKLIEDWVRRKYRLASRESLFQEDKDLAAAYRRLLRAGFRSGEILRVLKRFARNPELLETFETPDDSLEAD